MSSGRGGKWGGKSCRCKHISCTKGVRLKEAKGDTLIIRITASILIIEN